MRSSQQKLPIIKTTKAFKNLHQVTKKGVVWGFQQGSKDVTDDDPADGNGPDAVQTVEVIRI